MRLPLLTLLLSLAACRVTTHPTEPSTLGTPAGSDALVARLAEPGPVTVETIAAADWAVDRSGLLNLGHPAARDAGLDDGLEPIQVFFHVLRHPVHGTFIVDTGAETAMRDDRAHSLLTGAVASAMHAETFVVNRPLGEWLAQEGRLDGVFFTHLHLDHVFGARDVPVTTPLFTGPGEGGATGFTNLFVQGITNAALAGKGALREWQFTPDEGGRFDGVLDVFGDGSVWALWVPGHTPGSTAYLVRTPTGPVLLAGDACHTRWGWEHQVEPGTFTGDAARGAASFRRLLDFAAAHPAIDVRLGHQR
jgi:glyoxylase-like metal-dependent hydrolase (beta-lactamase superfamily II)